MKEQQNTSPKFGTFTGVYIPSILTILGVIMYLRMGWIAGHLGLTLSIILVILATLITFLTSLSISSIATNMHIGAGGSYYMISRSLGLETGASIGLPLYIAQTLGISFYLTGFSESLQQILPLPLITISMLALICLTLLAYISTTIVLKTQLIFFALIILSLVSFFSGDTFPIKNITSDNIEPTTHYSFWAIFAIFFPAVTGIETGLSMSGNLKNTSKALPLGTIAAVLTGLIIYLAIPIYFLNHVDRSILRTDNLIFQKISKYSHLVLLSIWGATLSSALGGLLGAPRTLQALAKDDILPRFFSKESKSNKNPRVALIITAIIALGALHIGSLNAIAPVVSMFFLISYGLINLSAGVQSLLATPSWRPTFKVPWTINFLGAFGCFAAMFMIDPGSSIIALLLLSLIYYIMHKRKLSSYWGDMRRGILMLLTKFSIERLLQLPVTTQSWYPNILVFSGPPSKRWPLIELGSAIANNKGFLTISCILAQEKNYTQKTIENFLKKRHIHAFVRISIDDKTNEGIISLIRDYGIGPIYPNTIILGMTTKEEKIKDFATLLIKIYQSKRNIILVRHADQDLEPQSPDQLPSIKRYYNKSKEKKICIWWGRRKRNAGLSLSLSYLLQKNTYWQDMELHLRTIVSNEDELESSNIELRNLIKEANIKASHQSYLKKDASITEIFDTIREKSQDCFLNFIGLLPPNLDKNNSNQEKAINEFSAYYKRVLELTKDLPPTVILMASEDLEFHKIFTKHR